ncbi:MAG TPA: alpha-1,4-glucan--maltose-1-phosphate maltosyltransferase [Terriglobia bacterium]
MVPDAPDPREPQARRRVVIERVEPQIDCGRFPIKRVVGDWVLVKADIFADGHDSLGAALQHWDPAGQLSEVPMELVNNDRWMGRFQVQQLGRHKYRLEAWVDPFTTWRRGLAKKVEAGQDVAIDLKIGAQLIRQAGARASSADAALLARWAARLEGSPGGESEALIALALSDRLVQMMDAYPDRRFATASDKLEVAVDPARARCSAWYEMFPRSCSAGPGKQGTFRDCAERLPYVASMGFDVLYLPPIHPIGVTDRKGRNNNPVAGPDDVGSPWAIGSRLGGHKDIEPQLGTLEDFHDLLGKCREHGLDLAVDIAFQCSPDHPYATSHPEWFQQRPDGSIQYAENPPKKYQDIYPLNFASDRWAALWDELKSVVLFWAGQGVRIFRVDNPHTKPFAFWEWLLAEIKRDYPDAIFLSEAFTRPKVMYRLAKLGFTHSYTYFAWRSRKQELIEYLTELTTTELREFFRPHFWPNTPDILTQEMQAGGRPTFMARLVLAATLSANYGIYGPAFELCENRALVPGKEEYLDAEKYQIRQWNLAAPNSLKPLIARVNQARREHPALQKDENLTFHPIDNEYLIAYSKSTEDSSDMVLVVVNLDPSWKQSGWTSLSLPELGLQPEQTYRVRDLLTDAEYQWQGARNYVELDPHLIPAHIFHVRR